MKRSTLMLIILLFGLLGSFYVLLNIVQKPALNTIPSIALEEKPNEPSKFPEQKSDIYQCNTDDDCVVISVGSCCDFTSVNKKYHNEIKFVPMICAQYCPVSPICKNSACQVKSNF